MSDLLFQNLGWGRRRSLRRHFGYPAQIHFGEGAPSHACVIIDMSETGAQLEIPSEAELPPEFWLLVGGNANVRRQCRIVWRSGNRMGVRFRDERREVAARRRSNDAAAHAAGVDRIHRATKKFLSVSGSVTAPPVAIEYSIASVASSVARASSGVASAHGLPSAR